MISLGQGNRVLPFETGVNCEACHGPGAAHAKAPAQGNIVNPKNYLAGEINQLCGSCHRKPAASGDDTDWNNPWNVRHQPLYLAESACFRASEGRLSCLTCHDPHSGNAEAGCASCHPDVKHQPGTRTAGRACIDCHMPKARPNELLAFTNHWIGVYATEATLMPRAPAAPRRSRPARRR
ncbi:MAG: cytochrome c3 family protein [Bryobacteraceae bacterium]|nr:cytochrome c3 family protein [Bryobacteraceae bacterium]